MPKKRARPWSTEKITRMADVGPKDQQATKAAWKRDARTDAKGLIDAKLHQGRKR